MLIFDTYGRLTPIIVAMSFTLNCSRSRRHTRYPVSPMVGLHVDMNILKSGRAPFTSASTSSHSSSVSGRRLFTYCNMAMFTFINICFYTVSVTHAVPFHTYFTPAL